MRFEFPQKGPAADVNDDTTVAGVRTRTLSMCGAFRLSSESRSARETTSRCAAHSRLSESVSEVCDQLPPTSTSVTRAPMLVAPARAAVRSGTPGWQNSLLSSAVNRDSDGEV